MIIGREAVEAQLKKGSLEIIVLQCLSEQDCYGYQLISEIDRRSDGYYMLREGSLYPVLYRLEDKGCVEHYQKVFTGERKIPRKYYKITDEGIRVLAEMKRVWEDYRNATDKALGNGGSYVSE